MPTNRDVRSLLAGIGKERGSSPIRSPRANWPNRSSVNVFPNLLPARALRNAPGIRSAPSFVDPAVFALMFPVIRNAATLRSNPVGACNKYLQTSNGSLQDRVRPGGAFIWPFEDGPLGIKVTIISPGSFRIDFAGTSTAMHEGQPKSPLADKTAQFRRDYNGKQPIQPAKAAAAVLNIARLDDPPLRLALGGDAVRFVERNDVAGGNPTGCGST